VDRLRDAMLGGMPEETAVVRRSEGVEAREKSFLVYVLQAWTMSSCLTY
jgi:hypothetical protein